MYKLEENSFEHKIEILQWNRRSNAQNGWTNGRECKQNVSMFSHEKCYTLTWSQVKNPSERCGGCEVDRETENRIIIKM